MSAENASAPIEAPATSLLTRASSITRALDQVGDKWCLLIIQEVFWGINTFSGMLEATGVSRGVLSDRLKWLQKIGCLQKKATPVGRRSGSYHLTRKSAELYATAMMAIVWERKYFRTPALDAVQLRHLRCGQVFSPAMRCRECHSAVDGRAVRYRPGPGAARDSRSKKVRRRSSLPASAVPSARAPQPDRRRPERRDKGTARARLIAMGKSQAVTSPATIPASRPSPDTVSSICALTSADRG